MEVTKREKRLEPFDITPTWEGIMPGILYVLEAGDNEGRKLAKEELMRLAKAVDKMNEQEDK